MVQETTCTYLALGKACFDLIIPGRRQELEGEGLECLLNSIIARVLRAGKLFNNFAPQNWNYLLPPPIRPP